MHSWKLVIPFLIMTICLITSCAKKEAVPGVKKGDIAISMVGSDSSKTVIDIEEYKGKVLVVDFWASWCPPCRKKIPSMVKAQDEYGEKGVQVLGVNLDKGVEALKDFEESEGLNFPSIFYGAKDIADDYNVSSIPTILIINKEGVITYRGFRPNLKKEIEKALED